MRKVWTIARREYGAMVATKAFLISISLMPLMMFGGVYLASRMKDMGDATDKRIVVVDGEGGALAGDMEQAAVARNEALAKDSSAPQGPAARYVIERYEHAELTDQQRFELSERVRTEEIEAFVVITAGLLNVDAPLVPPPKVEFYAPNPMLSAERGWVEQVISESVTARRVEQLGLDAEAVMRATAHVQVAPLGLVKQASDGELQRANDGRSMAGIFVPFGFMMLMFMVIFMSAQPLLESVMEEKSGRIAEVLLGSVSASQLMLGKLLGNVAGSLTVMAIYAVGGYTAAVFNGWTGMIPLELAPWFLVYQVLAVLLFSSVFMAVGAAVTQLKEAQTMLLPVWLLLSSPMFVWLQVVREPNGKLAQWMSVFPFTAPMIMVLRLASDATIPWWQSAAALCSLLLATALGVFLAGRIFRIGMLWQGKAPRIGELARWALRG